MEIVVPSLGESVSEATVLTWMKAVGDTVSVDETICELETDKVSLEVPSPVSGTLAEIIAPEGMDVSIGEILCVVAQGDVVAEGETGQANASTIPVKSADAPTQETSTPKTETASKSPSDTPKVAPSAAVLASENTVDVTSITPTGELGNVTKQDVQNAIQDLTVAPSAPTPATKASVADSGRGDKRVPMSKLRRVIASRLKDAQNTAALLTTFNEVDMSAVMALRMANKDAFEKKHGTKLGFMGFFVRATVKALEDFPAVNAEIDGNDIVFKDYKDVGIAVGTEQGLVVPILRNAETLSLSQIEGGIVDFGKRARSGKLTMAEMTGGTFTITNGGVFGSMLSTPIINPPQSAILGLHKIEKRPVVVNDEIVVRPIMYLALTYDHRIIDGREAVSFLVRIKELIENPEKFILDI